MGTSVYNSNNRQLYLGPCCCVKTLGKFVMSPIKTLATLYKKRINIGYMRVYHCILPRFAYNF